MSRRRPHNARASGSSSSSISDELAKEASRKLNSCSIMLVGNDERGSQEVARIVADALGYTPLHTMDVLEQSKGISLEQMEQQEGPSSVVLGEAEVLETAATFVRCVVVTSGSGVGAAARGDLGWRYIYGGVSVFLDNEASREADPGDDSRPDRRAYELAEIRVISPDTSASGINAPVVAEDLLRHIVFFIDNNESVIKKKSLYGAFKLFLQCSLALHCNSCCTDMVVTLSFAHAVRLGCAKGHSCTFMSVDASMKLNGPLAAGVAETGRTSNFRKTSRVKRRELTETDR